MDYGIYLSCPNKNFCLSVASPADSFTWDGSSWSGPVSMGNVGAGAVSCPTKTFCMAVDGFVLSATYTTS